jgi:hypothetical protein
MLEERQQKLLELVIEQYVATAEPVGSRLLVLLSGETYFFVVLDNIKQIYPYFYITDACQTNHRQ